MYTCFASILAKAHMGFLYYRRKGIYTQITYMRIGCIYKTVQSTIQGLSSSNLNSTEAYGTILAERNTVNRIPRLTRKGTICRLLGLGNGRGKPAFYPSNPLESRQLTTSDTVLCTYLRPHVLTDHHNNLHAAVRLEDLDDGPSCPWKASLTTRNPHRLNSLLRPVPYASDASTGPSTSNDTWRRTLTRGTASAEFAAESSVESALMPPAMHNYCLIVAIPRQLIT